MDFVRLSWNPMVGCDKFSKGCQNCYALGMALRFQKNGVKGYEKGFKVRTLPDRLNEPYTWRKPHKVFINAMSDLFHDDIPPDYLKKVFKVINDCPQHFFWFLTKRAENMARLAEHLRWSDNIMAGVTIECDEYRHRLDLLKQVPARYKFICLEPLIGPIKRLDLTGIDWVIVGGESGPCARPMNIDWVRDIKNWCAEQRVPFCFKQESERGGVKKPPLIDGKLYQDSPRLKPQKDLFDFMSTLPKTTAEG